MSDQTDIFQIKNRLKQELPQLSRHYHVSFLGIFGSYVHHMQNKNSDLDILVEFSETPGLLKFIELENHLSDLLGLKVDLVMKQSLKPGIGKRILKDLVPV
jgi:uncharacterized protein